VDINQASKLIEWLDEERRKDKNTIARLEERLHSQEQTIDSLVKRVNSVESDQTRSQSENFHKSRLAPDNVSENVRREMRELLERIEAQRLNAEREQDKRQEIAREALARPIRELGERVIQLEGLLTDLPAFGEERKRASQDLASLRLQLDDLQKRLSEPERKIAFIEEQRRQDNRRLSEIQTDFPELQKQFDGVRPRINLIEELALRNERRLTELFNSEVERREQIQQFIDQSNLVVQQQEVRLNELLGRVTTYETQIQQYSDRFEQWSETYREMKRVLDEFERLGDRLERRINEVAEMQRLSEERFRQEWNDWRTEDQRRFKQFTVTNDEIWRNHDKTFDKALERMNQVEKQIPILEENLEKLWQLERAHLTQQRDTFQSLLSEYDAPTKRSTLLLGNNRNSNPASIVPSAPDLRLNGESS
jgi:chromosome segregation ATPase